MNTIVQAQEIDAEHSMLNRLLNTYVQKGRVDYAGLKNNRQDLDRYLAELSRVKETAFKRWTKNERLAFLINLYNADTLQLIIDHYPVKRIKDIGGFIKGPWKQPVVKLFGKTITLNTLEHDIIRKRFNEPRVHAALVCAAALVVVTRFIDLQQIFRSALTWISDLGPIAPVVFTLLYVLACVLLLPGSILTLGAGVVFGVAKGSVYVSVASTLGATCAFLVGRYLARDWVGTKIAGNRKFKALMKTVIKWRR